LNSLGLYGVKIDPIFNFKINNDNILTRAQKNQENQNKNLPYLEIINSIQFLPKLFKKKKEIISGRIKESLFNETLIDDSEIDIIKPVIEEEDDISENFKETNSFNDENDENFENLLTEDEEDEEFDPITQEDDIVNEEDEN
jgi:hypothetical protein